MIRRAAVMFALVCGVVALAGCKARKDYPEPSLGYHSPNYNVVFGRLQKVAGRGENAPPTWVVRFGIPSDPYQGEFALTAPSPNFILGYSGGEPVEIHGHIFEQPTQDTFNGRWYVVESIQLWSGYRQ